MDAFPHHYTATASSVPEANVTLRGDGLPDLQAAPPAEFGGPGNEWSPETLLVAAIANCFVLTFKAIADASRVEWVDLACTVEGTLDRVEKVTRFTAFTVKPTLTVTGDADEDKLRKLLEKAEHNCLISNSLDAEMTLAPVIQRG